jgi:hypothetical protein
MGEMSMIQIFSPSVMPLSGRQDDEKAFEVVSFSEEDVRFFPR